MAGAGQSIATAYVQILPSTLGIGSGIAGALGGGAATGAASSAGAAVAGAFGAGFAGLGANLLKFIAPAAVAAGVYGIGKAAVTTGMEFDAAMSQVYALMARANEGTGLTADEMGVLRDRAREMGSTTQFTAEQAADAMSYMALAGWDAEQIYAGIPDVLNLAAASSMDLGRASDIVTDYMAAFSNTAPTATHLVDLLAYAQSASNATTDQFAEAWKYSAGMMNTAGQSADTTTAILARLADQAHKGSTGGVELNAVMTQLVKSMDRYGNIKLNDVTIPLKDSEGNFRNMIDVFGDMQMALGGIDQADAQQVSDFIQTVDNAFKDADLDDPATAQAYRDAMAAIADPAQGANPGSVAYMNELLGLFDNVRAFRGIAAILNGDVQGMRDFETALENADGTAANMAATVNDNLAGDLKILNSAFDDLKIAISDHLTPALRDLVQLITPVVQWLAERISGKTVLGEAAEEVEQLNPEQLSAMGAEIQSLMETLYNPKAAPEDKLAAAARLEELKATIANMDWTGTGADAVAGIMAGVTGYNFHGDAQALLNTMQGAIDMAFGINSPATAMVPTGEYIAAGLGSGLAQHDYAADAASTVLSIRAAVVSALTAADWAEASRAVASGIGRGMTMQKGIVSSAMGTVIAAAKSRAAADIGANGSNFVKYGKDIAKGIATGVKQGSEGISKALYDACMDAIEKLKDKLGIDSPSRLMADEIGKRLPQGVALGIEEDAGVAANAMAALVDDLTGPAGAAAWTPGAAAGPLGYVQNVTVNSPRALSPWEVARQTRNATRQMVEAMA